MQAALLLLAHALFRSGIIGHVSTIPPRNICPSHGQNQKTYMVGATARVALSYECPWIIAEMLRICQTKINVGTHRTVSLAGRSKPSHKFRYKSCPRPGRGKPSPLLVQEYGCSVRCIGV